MRRISLVGVLISGLLLINMLPATAQDEVGSGGVGGRPAYPRKDNERSKSIFIHTIKTGQSAQDGINVVNNSSGTKTVAVYATDSVLSSGGAFACKQKVEPNKDVGTWVTLAKNQVTLDSATSEVVKFTIKVPDNTDVGEHDGCIVVQEIKPEASAEQGIGLSFRTAIRVAVLVPGDIIKSLEITDLKAAVQEDAVILSPSVTNLGNVSIDADIRTDIKTIWRSQITQVGGQFPVLRGETGEWNFEHQKPFWGGWYRTSVSVKYDKDPDNFIGAAQSSVTWLGENGPLIFVRPQPLALAIELAIVLAILYGLYRFIKWRRLRKDIKNWREHTVKPGENVRIYGRATKVSWRTIARVNKLKPPYAILPGQKVKVPSKKPKR